VSECSAREIHYASGGYPPAILIAGPEETSQLISQNFFIGGMPDSTYKSGAVPLQPLFSLSLNSSGVKRYSWVP
jgi:serine phosphatase RsbU (regulator of sigma subunit)